MSHSASPWTDARFLVVGCGSIGKRHMENLRRLGVTDILAVEPSEDRRKEVAERFGARAFGDLGMALGEQPEVALICTPPSLHIGQAMAAARAGCHLFVEKPVADALDGVDELIAEVQRASLVNLVACNFRFHPGLRHIKKLLEGGELGTVVSARAQFGQYLPDWHPWEDYRLGYSARRELGGGVALDRIHEIDYMRWLFGEIDEVHAFAAKLSSLEIDTEDTVEIVMRFTSGTLGSVHLDYVRRTYDASLEIVGDLGTARWRYQDRCVEWSLAGESAWRRLEWPDYDGNQMYIDELRHLFRVLAGEEAAELDIAGAKRDLEVALEARESFYARPATVA